MAERDPSSPLLANEGSINEPPKGGIPRASIIAVTHLGLSFFLLFTAFNTLQSFESTVNKDLGIWSLACLYAFFSFSNLIAGAIVKKIGERFTLLIGGATYCIYIGANLYPRYYTLLPTAALLGFGAAILWTAQGSFMAKYSDSSNIGFFSGLFFALLMMNAVVGNLMAAIFLNIIGKGTNYLFIILSVIGVVATLSFVLLRKPPETQTDKSINILETLFLFKEKKMLILLPCIIYSGLSQSFAYSKLPQAMGTKWIGWVMACFGAADVLSSAVFGRISDKVGRKIIILISSLMAIAGYVASIWSSQDRPWLYFVILILLGLADGGYNTQLYAVMGTFQPEKLEASYAYFKFIQSSLTAVAFFISPVMTLTQLVILITASVILSLIAFFVCDIFVAKVDAPKQ